MTDSDTTTRSVVIEREMPHTIDKIWRALTESHLIAEWLMKNDFEPVVGRTFTLRSDPVPQWDGQIRCKISAIEPKTRLAYSWETMGAEMQVNFTLTKTPAGVMVRMEQSGFGPGADAAYKGATYGWTRFIGRLDEVVAGLD